MGLISLTVSFPEVVLPSQYVLSSPNHNVVAMFLPSMVSSRKCLGFIHYRYKDGFIFTYSSNKNILFSSCICCNVGSPKLAGSLSLHWVSGCISMTRCCCHATEQLKELKSSLNLLLTYFKNMFYDNMLSFCG